MTDMELSAQPTRQLAAFAAGLRYEGLPPAVVEKTKACVLDALGCMLFGSTLPWTRMVSDMVLEQGAAPQAAIVGTSHRTSVSQAVLVNATAGHAFELDDLHARASMHAGSVNVATALALAEWLEPLSGKEFITAIGAGYETGLRIGIAGADNIFWRGFHSAAVCGVFAAAATAARLLQLDAAQTQHALGVAGSQAAGLMAAQEGAMVKRLHSGRAAQSGVYGALLARRGFTGIPDVLEAPFGGFFSAMTDRYEPETLTAGLGEQWETLAVGFKGYATAGAIHTSLWALDDIMREQNLHAEDIAEIAVRCTSYCHQHVGWTYAPRGVAAAQLNLYYALAVMALDRAAMIEQFREERLADPRILAIIPRIHASPEPKYDALGNSFRYAIHMTVRTTGGAAHEREIMQRPGSPQNPLSAAQLRDKFALLARYALTQPQIDRVMAFVDELEQLPSVVPLAQALIGNEER